MHNKLVPYLQLLNKVNMLLPSKPPSRWLFLPKIYDRYRSNVQHLQ